MASIALSGGKRDLTLWLTDSPCSSRAVHVTENEGNPGPGRGLVPGAFAGLYRLAFASCWLRYG